VQGGSNTPNTGSKQLKLPHVAHADPPQVPSGGTANQDVANLFTDFGPGGCRGDDFLHNHNSFKSYVVENQEACEQ